MQIKMWFFNICEHCIRTVTLIKQSPVQTAICGAEFLAMNQGIDALRGLRYKLRMMSIFVSSPFYIYGNNMSLVHKHSDQNQI